MRADRRWTWRLGAFVAAALALILAGCADDESDDPPPTATSTAAATATPVPGVSERAVLRGMLTVDGAPLETEFLGARVLRDGLVGACQAAIPAVSGGQYELPVSADAEVRGCGAPGAEVVLWAYVGDVFLFSNEKVAWPGDDGEAAFDATFSAATPAGASPRVTELKGLLYDADARLLPGGSVVEAYIGEALCGVTSLRHGFVTEGYYTLMVVGPESVPGCAEGASIAFRIDGAPADGTAINDLGGDVNPEEVNLTLR